MDKRVTASLVFIGPMKLLRSVRGLFFVIGILCAATLADAECGHTNTMRLAAAGKLPLAVQASGSGGANRHASIAGLWHVTYSLPDGSFFFQSFDQFFADGNEWEGAALGPGAFCQGTWNQAGPGTVKLFHVGWNFDLSGALVGYFTETQTEKLSADGNRYQGTFDMKNFDLNGNPDPVFGIEISGSLSATRINGSFSLGG
jgi:hypothetical protein